MEMKINRDLCKGCGVCVPACPVEAISMVDGMAEIDPSLCTQCQACVQACPTGAIYVSNLPIEVHPKNPSNMPEAEVVTAEAMPLPATNRFLTTLSNVGSALLPRLANVLFNAWEQHALQGEKKSLPMTPQSSEVPIRCGGRGYRRRYQGGHQGHGINKNMEKNTKKGGE